MAEREWYTRPGRKGYLEIVTHDGIIERIVGAITPEYADEVLAALAASQRPIGDIDAELAAIHAYEDKHRTCDIQKHPWQTVFGAGFEAAASQRPEQAAKAERLIRALRKARGFASIVDDKIMGPLPDHTRWAIKDLVRILHEDIEAALAQPDGGEGAEP